jgi:hypothetical protein
VLISDFVYTVTGAMIVGLTTGTNQAGGFRAFGVDSSGNPTTFAPKTPSYGNNVRRVSWRELRN